MNQEPNSGRVSPILLTVVIIVLLAATGFFIWFFSRPKPFIDEIIMDFPTKTSSPLASSLTTLNEWQTYTNNIEGYTISYPTNWYVKEGKNNNGRPDISILSYTPGPDDQIVREPILRINYVKYPEEAEGSYIEYGFKNATGKQTISGVEGPVYYLHNGGPYDPVIIKETYLKRGAFVYAISENYGLKDKELDAILDQMVKTFKFIDPESPSSQATNSQTNLCTAEPTPTDIGRDIYPIDPKYSHLRFLGELFTADDCGAKRLAQIDGVKGDYYTLGSRITLNPNHSRHFLWILSEIGFQKEECTVSDCSDWYFKGQIKTSEILKLKPYASEIKADDCISCG